MERVLITADEVSRVGEAPPASPVAPPPLPPAVPWWARLSVAPLAVCLPLLCLVVIVLRVAFRNATPRLRHAWTAYLCTLLVISALLSSLGFVLALTLRAPLPGFVNTGLEEMDERDQFPALPAKSALSGSDVARELKSLVVVVSPEQRMWFRHEAAPSSSFGAGLLLYADRQGYLFATAGHVVGTEGSTHGAGALLATMSGVWTSAELVGRHTGMDLAMLWVRRQAGSASFVQPIATQVGEGEPIFVIGHPEGLKFSLAGGLVARLDGNLVQITAPISPGNSGGPVYDDLGRLVAVITSTMDKRLRPNAENLNFAARADALLDASNWEFYGEGRRHEEDFLAAERRLAAPAEQRN
jgi:S1-C subfamily serine protease